MGSTSRHAKKPGYRVLHEVSDLGFGARVAKTRGRLIAVAVLATVGFVAYARLSTQFMRAESTSVILNLVLITAAMLAILVVAFVQALLVGDLLFPGRWRERVILGKKLDVQEDESPDVAIGKFKDFTLPFYAVCGAFLAVNYLAYGWVSGGFLSEYHDFGYQATLLRSGDPEAQIRGIRNVVNPRNSDAQEVPAVRAALTDLAVDASEEVRRWAIWALGELAVFEAEPVLIDVVTDESLPDDTRALAAESLGRVARASDAEVMANLLGESFGRSELALGLLRGLGLAGVGSTASAIAPMLNVEPSDVRAHAYWALGRTGNREFRDLLVETAQHGSLEERCLAAEGLKFMVSQADRVEAHAWFARSEAEPCEPVVWTRPYHWDDEEQFRQEIVVGESLRAKYLKVIFAAGGVAERDFFAAVANDPDEPDAIRALARELALRIDHRR